MMPFLAVRDILRFHGDYLRFHRIGRLEFNTALPETRLIRLFFRGFTMRTVMYFNLNLIQASQ